MLLLWILVLVVGIAWLAHRRTAPLPALGIIAVYLLAMGDLVFVAIFCIFLAQTRNASGAPP